MPNKKIRFEVFKRDSFKCQYCGRTPPAVVLELDHIIPKAQGGPENIDNFITACFDCNRGKGKTKLDIAVPGIAENLALIKEKRKQLKAFNRFIEKQEKEYDDGIQEISEAFSSYFPDRVLTDRFNRLTTRRFLSLLPIQHIRDAMNLACLTKPDNPEQAIRYFCGICWNWIKQPETRDW